MLDNEFLAAIGQRFIEKCGDPKTAAKFLKGDTKLKFVSSRKSFEETSSIDIKHKNKDPFHTNLGSGPELTLRMNESESDILAKMYRFMFSEYQKKKKLKKKELLYQKELEKIKNDRVDELISLFTGKVFVPKTKKKTNKILMYALGAAGLLFSSDVMAMIGNFSDEIDELDGKFKGDYDMFQPTTEETMEQETTRPDMSADEMSARSSAEDYLGRALSDQEWDQLVRATHAESGPGTNVEEQAMVMGTILNRVRNEMSGGKTVTEILQQRRQFQAVTGTQQEPGPSQQYREGPKTEERKKSIFTAARDVLPRVPEEQTGFAAESGSAYVPGTSTEHREQLKRQPKSTVYGGTRFGSRLNPNQASTKTNLDSKTTNTIGRQTDLNTTPLSVKPGAGAENAHPGVMSLAQKIQTESGRFGGFNRFTAFNDQFHKNRKSYHNKGLAMDFVISDTSKSEDAEKYVRETLKKSGLSDNEFSTINEYLHPSHGSTGGHIHENFKSPESAEKFKKWTESSDKLSMNEIPNLERKSKATNSPVMISNNTNNFKQGDTFVMQASNGSRGNPAISVLQYSPNTKLS